MEKELVECSIENNIFLKEIEGDGTNDPDDSMLAREFYSEFWLGVLDKNIGRYRGETILSFNTIAGCLIRLLPIYKEAGFIMPKSGKERLDLIKSSNEIGKELKEKFIKFYRIYHTLANFMIFIKPNNYYKNKNSYLQYVKNREYHEFPDLLLKDIYLYYKTGGLGGNPKFRIDTNLSYFNSFGEGLNGWRKFIEENYLQDFFKDDKDYSILIQLAPADDVHLPYRQDNVEEIFNDTEKKNRCIHEIDKFVNNAILIIEKRAMTFSKYKIKNENQIIVTMQRMKKVQHSQANGHVF